MKKSTKRARANTKRRANPKTKRQDKVVRPFEGQILHVSGFWRNDRRGGLGFGYDFSGPGFKPTDGEAFARRLDESLRTYDRNANPADIEAQLRSLGEEKERLLVVGQHLPEEHNGIALMNIHWLEQRGHLQADEFNGISWAWVPKGSTELALCEVNPITLVSYGTIDVTELVKTGAAGAFRVVNDRANGRGFATDPRKLS